MIRVVVAEDSLTVRELLVAVLESDPDIRVVGQAKNGVEAVELARKLRPHLITMDVHMPLMDGFEATKEIMVQAPAPIVIVSSSSSGQDVDLSLNALRAGALTVVAKPDDPQSPSFNGRQAQLVAMVKAMADVKVVRRWARQPLSTEPPPPPPPPPRARRARRCGRWRWQPPPAGRPQSSRCSRRCPATFRRRSWRCSTLRAGLLGDWRSGLTRASISA